MFNIYNILLLIVNVTLVVGLATDTSKSIKKDISNSLVTSTSIATNPSDSIKNTSSELVASVDDTKNLAKPVKKSTAIVLATTSTKTATPTSKSAKKSAAPTYRPKLIGYYTEWQADKLPAAKIPYWQLTHINYAFGKFDNVTYNTVVDNPDLLKEVSERSKPYNCKVLISVGGWENSESFSTMASNSTNRSKFISNIQKFVHKYKIDGIDLDWEFPGVVGKENNIFNPANDTLNLIKLISELRLKMPTTLLSLAVSASVYQIDSKPATDLNELSKKLDFVNLMSYDVNGPWSETTGPVAPLQYLRNRGTQNSIVNSLNSWRRVGFQKQQLNVGLPFYGYIYQLFNNSTKIENPGLIDAANSTSSVQIIPQHQYFKFQKSIGSKSYSEIQQSFNTKQGWKGPYHDKLTNSVWNYHTQTNSIVNYDDSTTLKYKAQYTYFKKYGGIMVWSINMDTDKLELLNSINFNSTEMKDVKFNLKKKVVVVNK